MIDPLLVWLGYGHTDSLPQSWELSFYKRSYFLFNMVFTLTQLSPQPNKNKKAQLREYSTNTIEFWRVVGV